MTITTKAVHFLMAHTGVPFLPVKMLAIAGIPGADATLSRKLRGEEKRQRPTETPMFGQPYDDKERLRKLPVQGKNGRWNTWYYYGVPMTPEQEAMYQDITE